MEFRPLLALGCWLGCSPPPAPPSSDWDVAATDAVKAEVDRMFKDIDAGNFEVMLGRMDTDATAFDFDANNNPVSMHGIDEIRSYFGQYEQGMKEGGMAMKSQVSRTDCRATPVMGYCAVEFDQTVTQGGQTMGPFKFRGTLVARKIGETWKWTHWHGSFREPPPTS